MGLLSGFALGKLTELPHPTINKPQCVNQYRRRNCTACIDICPEQVIGKGLVVKSWAGCIDCGRCASVCDTRAITPSENQLNQLLNLRNGKRDTVWLGCEQSERANDLTRVCLCELTWEQLAYLAFHKHLVLDLQPCGGCEHTACRDLLGKNLQQLHSFFGGAQFEERVTLAKSSDTAPKPEEEYSRRGLIKEAANLSKSGVGTLLRQYPILSADELRLDGVSARKLLHTPMKQAKQDFFWEIPEVKGECTGCGICVKKCPTKALSISEDGEMLVLESWRCVNCKSCELACHPRALKGTQRIRISDFRPLKLASVKKLICRSCGAVMKAKTTNGLCVACTQKRMQMIAKR